MLHEALVAYLERVEQAISRCRGAYVERYVEEVIAPERVNLRSDSDLRKDIYWRSTKPQLSTRTRWLCSTTDITARTVGIA